MAVRGKRPANPSNTGPSKKRKIGNGAALRNKNTARKIKPKGKEKAYDREYVPIPTSKTKDLEDDDVELSEQDLDVLQGASFLRNLDEKGIMKSKKEIERLHQLHKPIRLEKKQDDLLSLDSSDEEADLSSVRSSRGSLNRNVTSEDEGASPSVDSDAEMPYEKLPRKRRALWDEDDIRTKKIQGLPIKLPNGTIQRSNKVLVMSDSEQSSDERSEDESTIPQFKPDDVATGARFGRAAVADIISKASRKERIESAKEQIASICQDILAEPENSLGLLRRLHTFSLREISAPTHSRPIPNDPIIQRLTFLSQLAVFKDIIPGYRIRPLTDKEKAEKVSSMVARTREWEQGLVTAYQNYLRSLEIELKEHTELAETALTCMCTLLAEVTHFNFSANLISCIVARLSRKTWNQSSELCVNTIIKVFREDLTGAPSLEIVRMMNRMIKEKSFAVHPNVLSCLLHLRLRNELGVRASTTKVDKEDLKQRSQRHRKGKKSDQPHLSKKAKKALKERKEIEKKMHEAEAEVDKEERAVTQTETLKLLFTLYFRILKNSSPTPLLPAALTGIAKFAHLINVDFFRDLMQVLKDLISIEVEALPETEGSETIDDLKYTHHRLQCISTAFELLSGQGEALNIDLSDFITNLYAMILPLSVNTNIESSMVPSTPAREPVYANTNTTSNARTPSNPSTPPNISDLLFRCLHTVFSPRTGDSSNTPPWRSAAFAKRLLTAALHWPSPSALRALELVHALIVKVPRLEALLSTEDRAFDGIYRPDVDDPQLCHPFGTAFWELQTLATRHVDPAVRDAAKKILNFSRAS